jgi:hypothetical protein
VIVKAYTRLIETIVRWMGGQGFQYDEEAERAKVREMIFVASGIQVRTDNEGDTE